MWFSVDDSHVPPHVIRWSDNSVTVQWWNNVILDYDYLQCLLYVDLLDQAGHLHHSVVTVADLVPVQLQLDLCHTDWLEIQYTMMADNGQR